MTIQCCLTAAVMNLKRLAAFFRCFWKLLAIIAAGGRPYGKFGGFQSSFAQRKAAISMVGPGSFNISLNGEFFNRPTCRATRAKSSEASAMSKITA
jgi:hypothetical protein